MKKVLAIKDTLAIIQNILNFNPLLRKIDVPIVIC